MPVDVEDVSILQTCKECGKATFFFGITTKTRTMIVACTNCGEELKLVDALLSHDQEGGKGQ